MTRDGGLFLVQVWPTVITLLLVASLGHGGGFLPARAADLARVPLFDAERSELLNAWGGAWAVGNARSVTIQCDMVHAGARALAVEMGPVEPGQDRYVQCLASGFGRHEPYYQTRDVARYERLEFHVSNAAGVRLRAALHVKDFRDSEQHRASFAFDLPARSDWVRVEVPLSLSAEGWTVEGRPDLRRVLTLDFRFQPEERVEAGRVYLDDLVLVERGGPLAVETSELTSVVERLARRQWDALWAARSHAHGMIPNTSYQATDAGLNTTAAVLWMLPAAVARGWVEPAEAEAGLEQLADTLGRLRAQAKYLPARNVDWLSLKPSLLPEESSVDAAFLALALHRCKSQPALRAGLRAALDEVQDGFDFAAFASATGWRMAYRYPTRHDREGFVPWVYNGYTNESNVISLAAHLSRRHHVPIETYWSSGTHRARVRLTGLEGGPIVHSLPEFRAPFTQALLNLFVDVRSRGTDSYPDNGLATNPWHNFVCYQQHVMGRLAELGRPHLVQPDAGDDGTLNNYRQFSLYEDFGQKDLFMPWSVAFALLAGAERAEASLRFLLAHGLHDPFGLADSARWATGAAEPYAVTARHDFWNTSLSTMALLEWLEGEARSSASMAALPEVSEALDRVFHAPRAPRRTTSLIGAK